MKIYKNANLNKKHHKGVIAIGNFDGIHLGHQKVINEARKKAKSKKLVCTNPDLIVHRGDKEEYCAGYIAKIFEGLGGKVTYYGKPHKEIYEMCFKPNEKVLAIGDNLRTDIKGANNLNKDCLFISNGVHRNEFNNNLELEKLLSKYKVKANYFQKELQW